MNVQRLTLDLNKSSVPRGRVTIAQCDHDGTTVEAEIYDNGVALSTSGLSAYLVMRLPDGRHYYRVPATLDGHVATALMDEAYAATVAGTTEIAYFELVGSGGVVYSTSRFGVRVLPSATAGATVPESWDGEVERLIQQLDEMAESSREIINDLTTLEEAVGAAEQGRVAAESGRVGAETARANAESGRTSAEQGRVTAESSRASEFSTLKSESQAATSAANTAARSSVTSADATVDDTTGTPAVEVTLGQPADGGRKATFAFHNLKGETGDTYELTEQDKQDIADIVGEQNVPLMSPTTRGGAKLEEHGGLVLRDEKLGIGSLVQESDGAVRGGIAELTAKGHAEQDGTPTPESPVPIQVVTGHTVTGETGRFVDLVVKLGSTMLFTIPIPLPQRGWVAGLPDGTADTLRLDGAGKVEWELDTWAGIISLLPTVYTVNGVKGAISGLPTSFVRTPMLCDRARYVTSDNAAKDTFYNNPANVMMLGDSDDTIDDLKTKYNGATVLYALATPVIEDCGYVEDWPKDLPEGAVIDIPELSEVGIKYFIDSTVTELARQWYERANSEYADRLTALEQAVAELATS